MNDTKDDDNQKQIRFKAALDLDEPSQELLEWAKKNINEDPDTRDLFISELRDMIFERGECNPSRTDDEFLLRFLRARRFCVKRAHRLYVLHHNYMEESPEFFTNVNLNKMVELRKTNIFNCPVTRDQHGRRMFIFRIGEWVPTQFTPVELLQFVVFATQMGILEQKTQIKGAVGIIDLGGLSLDMMWYMSPALAKHMYNITAGAMPTRVEAMHFLHSTWIFDTAYTMLKAFIPENVKHRVHFHNDFDTLHTHIDPKNLPKSLGGAQEEYSLESWYNDVVQVGNDKVEAELDKLGYSVQDFLNN